MSGLTTELAEAIVAVMGYRCLICDSEQVISASGKGSKEYQGQLISKELESLIHERKGITMPNKALIPIITKEEQSSQLMVPIISAGDAVGAVILLADSESKEPGIHEQQILQIAAGYLGRMMEN